MKKLYTVLIYVALALILDIAMVEKISAQPDASSQAAAMQAQTIQPDSGSTSIAPQPAPAPAVVAVPEPAAPPSWATDLLMEVSRLPVVGPYVSKALLYLGILTAILTTLVAAILSILASLQGGFNAAGLVDASNAVTAFKNGKIMYWLTYFSNFNAQKKPPVA